MNKKELEVDRIREIAIQKVSKHSTVVLRDELVIEEPLEINLRLGQGKARKKHHLAITMRTPGNDKELAIGFLFSEGLIHRANEILDIQQIEEHIIEISLDPQLPIDLEKLQRHFYTSSSCGVCGKTSLEMVQQHISYILKPKSPLIPGSKLADLLKVLDSVQLLFSKTGGNHAAALFSQDIELLSCQEDVGRHNALDKLIGNAFLEGLIPLDQHLLLLSGRISFELVQKALMAGIPIIVAVGAPSSLAVELADAHGMTLIGFLKKDSFNIYCGAQRIIF